MENPVSAVKAPQPEMTVAAGVFMMTQRGRSGLHFCLLLSGSKTAWCAPDADPVTTNTNTGLMPPLLLTTVTPLKRHLDTLPDEKLHQVRRMTEAVVSS